MINSYTVLKTIIHTEKSATYQEPKGQYLFWVDKNANKIAIRKAVEDIYKVKVKTVNTLVVPGKAKRVRYQLGRTADWKKALVSLKKGEKISEGISYGAK